MLKKFFSIIFLLLLASCAAKLPYSANYPLTQQYFHSKDGSFYGRLPEGWFVSTEDTLGQSLDVWLLKEDLSATLTFQELNLDHLTTQRVHKEGIKLLAYLCAEYHSDNMQHTNIEPIVFELNNNKFCSYEIVENKNTKRVTVFSVKGKFYECEALVLKGEWSTKQINALFSIQQTVLASIGS